MSNPTTILHQAAPLRCAWQPRYSSSRLFVIAALNCLCFLFYSCQQVSVPAPPRITLDSTLVAPISQLTVPIYFPVQELENMINEKLQARIIEAKLAITSKNDSIYLSISRFQPVRLTYDGNRGVTYRVPVQIDGFLNSKVAGIRIKNKEAIRAKVIITMVSDLYLDDNWNLAPKTELKKIEWVEEPKLNVAGIKINLKGSIEKVLNNNQDKIESKLDESAKEIIKIRQSIEKLWADLQKPIRINRKVVPVWLKMDAVDIDGKLMAKSVDTLMIEARLNTRLSTVLDSAASLKKPGPLPRLKRQVEGGGDLEAYALATLPFELLNTIVNEAADTMKFSYSGKTVRINSCELYGTPEGLAIGVDLRGDLNARVYLRGTLAFDSLGKKVVIDNFRFDINSEETLLKAADWLGHDAIIERLRPYLSIPIENLFAKIPDLINAGIEKGKLGKKINLNFEELDVSFYSHLITSTNIQLILSAKGKATIELQKGLFDKKKKAPL